MYPIVCVILLFFFAWSWNYPPSMTRNHQAGQAPGEIGPIIDTAAMQRISKYVGDCES